MYKNFQKELDECINVQVKFPKIRSFIRVRCQQHGVSSPFFYRHHIQVTVPTSVTHSNTLVFPVAAVLGVISLLRCLSASAQLGAASL